MEIEAGPVTGTPATDFSGDPFEIVPMVFCLALVLPLLLCVLGPVFAAEDGASSHEVDACQADIHRLCETVFPDTKLVATCLVDRRAELSSACAQLLARESDMRDTSAR